jgi:hypothetical protein
MFADDGIFHGALMLGHISSVLPYYSDCMKEDSVVLPPWYILLILLQRMIDEREVQ